MNNRRPCEEYLNKRTREALDLLYDFLGDAYLTKKALTNSEYRKIISQLKASRREQENLNANRE